MRPSSGAVERAPASAREATFRGHEAAVQGWRCRGPCGAQDRHRRGGALVIVSFAGELEEPRLRLARPMEAWHPGLRIRLVPPQAQDIIAQITAAQGYSPFDAMPSGDKPNLTAMAERCIAWSDDAVCRIAPAACVQARGADRRDQAVFNAERCGRSDRVRKSRRRPLNTTTLGRRLWCFSDAEPRRKVVTR